VRLLFATNAMGMGGIEKNLLLLAREITRRGHALTVLSSGGVLAPLFLASGAEHVLCPISLRDARRTISAARILRSVVDERDVELIHVFSASAAIVAKFA
jgi:Glycosyltransferase Family 4